jgi:hypothetical protein
MCDKDDMNNFGQSGGVRPGPLWWIGQLMLTGAACFFVFFGISLLMAAYQLKDPFSFIMTFFAANFIILISAVMVVGFVMRTFRKIRAHNTLTFRGVNKKK